MLGISPMLNSRRPVLIAAAALVAGCVQAAAAEGPSTGKPNSPGVEVAPGTPGPQTSSDAPRNIPDLRLTPSQKEAVYQSIHNQKVRKSTEPIGFRAAVGAHVPDSISVAPLPLTVIDLAPSLKDYEYAFVANQVLIVQPQSKTVVAVIAE